MVFLLLFGVHRYVPNALRGGMISLSQAPANAAILLFLVQVSVSSQDYFNIENIWLRNSLPSEIDVCHQWWRAATVKKGHNWTGRFHHEIYWLNIHPLTFLATVVLMQGKYYNNIGNSTIIAFAALGLFTAAGCMHVLKRWGKQPYQNWHKLWFYTKSSASLLAELVSSGDH